MKITKSQLKRIIKEELGSVVQEGRVKTFPPHQLSAMIQAANQAIESIKKGDNETAIALLEGLLAGLQG